MQKLKLGAGLLVGILLTAALLGIMDLAAKAAGLPFVPFDLFDWMTRILPGPVVTYGIDHMISAMLWLGLDVADTAKTAEHVTKRFHSVTLSSVQSQRPTWQSRHSRHDRLSAGQGRSRWSGTMHLAQRRRGST